MINVKQWMGLPKEVREHIAIDFNLPKTGRIGISNNKVISDGYTQDDITKVNLENLQKILDVDETDFESLFVEYTLMIQNKLITVPVEELDVKEQEVATPVEVTAPTEEVNPNVTTSGDKETYFGTKIKPVTYKPNDKKTNKRG